MVINRNFVKELKPLLTLAKALNWESIYVTVYALDLRYSRE